MFIRLLQEGSRSRPAQQVEARARASGPWFAGAAPSPSARPPRRRFQSPSISICRSGRRSSPPATARSGSQIQRRKGGRKACEHSEVRRFAGIRQIRSLWACGLSPAEVVFHQGWFQNTLPAEAKSIGPISVLRLDGDWYASTKICLEHLYPLLSRDGIVILDDYFLWEGCKKGHRGVSPDLRHL